MGLGVPNNVWDLSGFCCLCQWFNPEKILHSNVKAMWRLITVLLVAKACYVLEPQNLGRVCTQHRESSFAVRYFFIFKFLLWKPEKWTPPYDEWASLFQYCQHTIKFSYYSSCCSTSHVKNSSIFYPFAELLISDLVLHLNTLQISSSAKNIKPQ